MTTQPSLNMYCLFPGLSPKIVISSCDGQMVTGDNLGVYYTAINSHCNCTILPKYNGSLIFASTAINENCYTEISILKVNKTKLSTLTTIPCKGPRLTPTFPVTHDDMFYMTSRSVNTTNEQERFLQDITIFGSIQFFKLILIYSYMCIFFNHYRKSANTRTIIFKYDQFNMNFSFLFLSSWFSYEL